ncbi:MAG TPA: KH domain-containing protein, partial [Aquificales bacterium]|nr:KH domain-containing protein [Aquificales bacterium]
EKPDQVQVREIEGERTVVIELRVAPEDLGKIIGRQGRIARALRLLLTAMARKQNKRAVLEILE